jgi:hypothetical protein
MCMSQNRTVSPLIFAWPADVTMRGMNPREDFDITVLLADIVAPALRSVFKVGEVESVKVAWEEPVILPDATLSAPTELNVHLVCKGEQHTSQRGLSGSRAMTARFSWSTWSSSSPTSSLSLGLVGASSDNADCARNVRTRRRHCPPHGTTEICL